MCSLGVFQSLQISKFVRIEKHPLITWRLFGAQSDVPSGRILLLFAELIEEKNVESLSDRQKTSDVFI